MSEASASANGNRTSDTSANNTSNPSTDALNTIGGRSANGSMSTVSNAAEQPVPSQPNNNSSAGGDSSQTKQLNTAPESAQVASNGLTTDQQRQQQQQQPRPPVGVTPSFVGFLKLDYEPNPFEHSFATTAAGRPPAPNVAQNMPAAHGAIGAGFNSRTMLPPVSSIASPDILSAVAAGSPFGYNSWSPFARSNVPNPLSPAIYDSAYRADYMNNGAQPSMGNPTAPVGVATPSGGPNVPNQPENAPMFQANSRLPTGLTPGANDSFRSLLTPGAGVNFPAPSPGTAALLGLHPSESQQFNDPSTMYRYATARSKLAAGTAGMPEQTDYFGTSAAANGLYLLSQAQEQQKARRGSMAENPRQPISSTDAAAILNQAQSQMNNGNTMMDAPRLQAQQQQQQQQPSQSMPYYNVNGNTNARRSSIQANTAAGQQPSQQASNITGIPSGARANEAPVTIDPSATSLNRPVNTAPAPKQEPSEVNGLQSQQTVVSPESGSHSPESQSKTLTSSSQNGGSANGKGSSRRGAKYETDEDKRRSFLERNRQAALKCRQRKKQWLSNLQAKVEFYGNENEILSAQVTALREEIVSLKTLLIAHKDCPVAQSNSVAVANSAAAPTMTNRDAQRINLGF
ncbi:transcription factor Atf1 [Schizosaccharomyces japonicus yFS275]|uniref:Transcription factor Atf1 n=1 Tax=Schizosaccharomyces japonicus (strain yFS275 / FY16936) TaxID=402676 RepID=B6JV63_SCHJY|nr:transcription factor Atf1 [Schizosaccharomyces japonicus yFS275]EEB05264.1 transcription factor Atf1 [Schizosaccharomyces japonicus yFS275]